MTVRSTNYGFATDVPWSQAETIDRVTAALKDEGFGVLTTIDVQRTLKEKLQIDSRPYAILGACNPQLAHRALAAEPEIGLLLPCNVVVYETDQGRIVAATDPETALTLAGNAALAPIAREARLRLERAIGRLGTGSAARTSPEAVPGPDSA
jgi:uncharacterized protein (DUF302 family)